MRWKADNPLGGLPYALGDLRTEDGGAIWAEIDKESDRLAPLLVEQLASTPAYRLLAELLPSEKVPIYFRHRVKREITPAIRALRVAQWHANHENKPDKKDKQHEVVWHGHQGLGHALLTLWPSDDIPLILGESRKSNLAWRPIAGRWYRRTRRFAHRMRRPFSQGGTSVLPISPEPTIAVHYVEGVDLSRRSDLFWYEKGLVDPQRILIIFEGRPQTPDSALQVIEKLGMRWVCLEHLQVARAGAPVWSYSPSHDSLLPQFLLRIDKSTGPSERWAAMASEWFLRQVDYWASFYKTFNVKVHVDVGGARDYHLAQSIALDLTDGVRLGWQRSEQLTAEGWEIGHQSNHTYFTWSARALSDDAACRYALGPVLVSGFPYDATWGSDTEPKRLRASLAKNGASLVVALFDNMFTPDGLFSKTSLIAWYKSFLEWVLEEPRVGILTKSKKPIVFQQLPELRELMSKAEATGRWINLTEVFGRLPSDASRAADISVGVGISTAANEAVAAGGKAVHCDFPAMRRHPFYQWGYERVVFDDLERMMGALKRYLADPAGEASLGDFSPKIDQVDPFRDGMARERVGSYIACLLAGFDAGLDRDQAVQQASIHYAGHWGEKYVIQSREQPSPAGI